ncbi:MAG: 2,3-bisphosphoglycerate-independent phosphoglycerate mutase [Candidatus Margulisbacteria bacterium]|nr:2,3-bisphosphoglycerate-independent phosphoglycerate mutase [Candidatus Margulisiibacteriota bacterium]
MPVYLCILDGFAAGENSAKNAIYDAIQSGTAPFLKDLFANHPYALLEASGRAVGLPPGTMGNSEVNHLNMGAGRVVYQSIERINVAIEDGSFFGNEALLTAVNHCKKNNSTLHLMGILQGHGGTVHGSIAHTSALLDLVKKEGLSKVKIHLFTDGRDTNPKAAGEIYLKMLEDKIAASGLSEIVQIASVMGREVAMDRDTAWQKILVALKALIGGEGERKASTAREAIESAYQRGETDEFIRPTIIGNYSGIEADDAVIFWNYRQDRAIELTVGFRETDHKFFNYKKGTKPISEEPYQEIERVRAKIKNIPFVAMTEYYHGMNALAAFPEKEIPETVGEIVSKHGLKQLRLAGPEKFAHVTGWFSGRRSEPFPGEDRHLAQDLTLKERTEQGKRYDLVPEMTAYLETNYSLKAIAENKYSLIVHNFQNGDMIGHTGNLTAAIAAVGHISSCLSKIVPEFIRQGGIFVLTADHGNCDEMLIRKGNKEVPSTQHSLNKVPFWVLGKEVKLAKEGIVPDVGVTVLQLMGLPASKLMTAKSLV